MKIILKSLELFQFRKQTGKWSFKKGKNVFLGRNGAGKTTLCDAERWLRTGKDSQGSAKFDIKTIVDGEPASKGNHSVKFNAEDLASGTYFYRLKTRHFQKIRKMILIK